MLKITRFLISRDEMLEAMEYIKEGRMKSYIYTYKIRHRKKWVPLARWDNIDGVDHMDLYDETGNYMKTLDFQYRKPGDLLKIIKTFRKNIIATDIENL